MLSLGSWKVAGVALALALVLGGGAWTTRALERSWRHEAEAETARVESERDQAIRTAEINRQALDQYMTLSRESDAANAGRLAALSRRTAASQRATAAIVKGGANVPVEKSCPGIAAALRGMRPAEQGGADADGGSPDGLDPVPR